MDGLCANVEAEIVQVRNTKPFSNQAKKQLNDASAANVDGRRIDLTIGLWSEHHTRFIRAKASSMSSMELLVSAPSKCISRQNLSPTCDTQKTPLIKKESPAINWVALFFPLPNKNYI